MIFYIIILKKELVKKLLIIQETIKPVIDKYSKELGEDLVKQMFEEAEKARK